MLTHDQELKLIKHYRSLYAKILKRERTLYSQGAEVIVEHKYYKTNYFVFMDSHKIVSFSQVGDLDLDVIIEEKQKASESMGFLDTALQVDFDVSDINGEYNYCSDCGRSDSAAEVTISYIKFSFPKLSSVKKYIKYRIDNMLRDAKFKFVHQAGGKDVLRYLEIIDKVK